MTKEKYWLESQGRGERLKHHAGRSEEEKVRRFYKKLVKKRKKKEKEMNKGGGKEGDGSSSRVKKAVTKTDGGIHQHRSKIHKNWEGWGIK